MSMADNGNVVSWTSAGDGGNITWMSADGKDDETSISEVGNGEVTAISGIGNDVTVTTTSRLSVNIGDSVSEVSLICNGNNISTSAFTVSKYIQLHHYLRRQTHTPRKQSRLLPLIPQMLHLPTLHTKSHWTVALSLRAPHNLIPHDQM